MKVLLFNIFIIVLVFSFQNVQAEPDYNAEDFTFDPTTSTLVPKFMGKVMLVRGKVFATNSEGRRQLSKGNKVYKKDTIATTSNQRALPLEQLYCLEMQSQDFLSKHHHW